MLDGFVYNVYKDFGITDDNDSVFVPGTKIYKRFPLLEDIHKAIKDEPVLRRVYNILTPLVNGSLSVYNKHTNVNLDNKYIVLDTSGMPADLLLPGIFWATNVANDLIMDSGAELSALLADELWALAGATSNSHVAGFILEMVKTIRGLGGIAITSTQGMQDLFGLEGGKYGKGILDSSRIKLVMQMEEQEARLIQGVLNLSEEEVRQITRFRRGEGLLCIGYNHVPIAIHVTPKEYDAITTSPTDLRARREGQSDE